MQCKKRGLMIKMKKLTKKIKTLIKARVLSYISGRRLTECMLEAFKDNNLIYESIEKGNRITVSIDVKVSSDNSSEKEDLVFVVTSLEI